MPSLPPDDAALEDLRALVAALREANARLREVVEAKDAQLEAAQAQIAVLSGRVADLERRLGKDSSTSSKPPSSDSPYRKKPRDRSLRGRSGRRPGKQPGAQSSTLRQSPDPDERVECWPAACRCCGADLADAQVASVCRRQVFEAQPAPPPTVTEYRVVAKECPGCGAVTEGVAPEGVTSLVQYGPGVHARAALAVCGHYLPVARGARLMAAYTGVNVSAGFMAGVRGKAASRLGPFIGQVRELLRAAGVLYADETRPAPPAACATCTSPAPSSSPPCTPVTAPRRRSTPAACSPAIPARSCGTATPATTI